MHAVSVAGGGGGVVVIFSISNDNFSREPHAICLCVLPFDGSICLCTTECICASSCVCARVNV